MGVSRAFSSCALVVLAAGCVEAFPGANVQIDFGAGTPTPARAGQTPAPGQPPANTYFALWASRETTDDMGIVVRNDQFEVQQFEIRPVIDLASPCFIDLDDARYPGIHVTRALERMQQDTGIPDPLNPPEDVNRGDLIDVLTARQRNINLPLLQNAVKTVATASLSFQYSNVGTTCGATQGQIPPPECTDDASNEQRLIECRAQWATDPLFYEGSDKVFSLPLNGTFYGVVEGMNPVNNGFLGGSAMFVDEALDDVQSFSIRWQFKDLNRDGAPDGTTTPAIGTLFMSGRPEIRTRGVKNVSLVNPDEVTISAEMAIFVDLASDDVTF